LKVSKSGPVRKTGVRPLYNLSVLLRTAVSTIVLLALSGCTKNIQTKEAVQAALVEHLSKVSGLNMSQMKMDVGSVAFRENEVDATVTFVPNGMDPSQGMQMVYTLERKGDTWAVKSKRGGMHDTTAPPTAMPPAHPPVAPK
jgi:hypothetical protein